jgi:hypothetical protein
MRPLGLLACLALPPALAGAPPPPADTVQLSLGLRSLLIHNLPEPLVESSTGWGATKEIRHAQKNHGTWRRMHVSVDRPEATLWLTLGNLVTPEPGRLTFDVLIECDANLFFEQQIWERGVKLFSGSTRARCHVKLLLNCEATSRVEKTGGLLPDAVIRLRVLRSDLRYDHLVCEHTAGVGGSAAKLLGEAVHRFLQEWRPGLERDLLARANAAIVKAGDTHEIRLGFSKLIPTLGK